MPTKPRRLRDTNGGSTPRDPSGLTAKGQRSRARLLEAALKIFSRDGFQGTRITDIADAAGAAHGSFYTYFDSKDAIFIALLEEMEGRLSGHRSLSLDAGSDGSSGEDGNGAHLGSEPYDHIRRRNHEYLAAYLENREIMVVWEQVATLNEEVAELRYQATMRFVRRVEESIRRLQSSGDADPRLDPFYAAHALAGMVSRFAYTWVLRDEPFDLERSADQLSLLWTNALGLEHPGRDGNRRAPNGSSSQATSA